MEMEKKKKDYEAPDIKVTQVEIESSICTGSDQKGEDVKFGGSAGSINVESQGIEDAANNDFSDKLWGDTNS